LIYIKKIQSNNCDLHKNLKTGMGLLKYIDLRFPDKKKETEFMRIKKQYMGRDFAV